MLQQHRLSTLENALLASFACGSNTSRCQCVFAHDDTLSKLLTQVATPSANAWTKMPPTKTCEHPDRNAGLTASLPKISPVSLSFDMRRSLSCNMLFFAQARRARSRNLLWAQRSVAGCPVFARCPGRFAVTRPDDQHCRSWNDIPPSSVNTFCGLGVLSEFILRLHHLSTIRQQRTAQNRNNVKGGAYVMLSFNKN